MGSGAASVVVRRPYAKGAISDLVSKELTLQATTLHCNVKGQAMNKIIILLSFTMLMGGGLYAQAKGPGGQGGAGGKAPSKADVDNWRKQQAEGDKARKEGDQQRKEALDRIGWGEDGQEERVEPGQTTPDKDKETWIKTEMTKLTITDKKQRGSFKKIALKAWRDSEAEDLRYAGDYKRVKDHKDAEAKLEEPRKKHQENLKKLWDKSDEELKKKELVDDDKLKLWQEDTKQMREKTATDKSAEQDKIRARKIEELRKQYAGGQGGEAGEPEKKAKKKEEPAKEGESSEEK